MCGLLNAKRAYTKSKIFRKKKDKEYKKDELRRVKDLIQEKVSGGYTNLKMNIPWDGIFEETKKELKEKGYYIKEECGTLIIDWNKGEE